MIPDLYNGMSTQQRSEMMSEKMPPENERPHIVALAQIILDAVQPYASEHGLDLATVMSAIGTASGGMIARAYSDPQVVEEVSGRLSIAAWEFAKILIQRDIADGRRSTKQ